MSSSTHSRCRHQLARARQALRPPKIELGGLRHRADLRWWRSVSAGGEVDTDHDPNARALGIPAAVESLTPAELINACLKAPVDLMWNGGIGTYVKAITESHADVGDKANDGLRVDGCAATGALRR